MNRIKLGLWFICLGLFSFVSPRFGRKVLIAYMEKEQEVISNKIDELAK